MTKNKCKAFTYTTSEHNLTKVGFTLIELLVVIAIISLLSSVVLASVSGARDKARVARALAFERDVHHKLMTDNIDNLVGEWTFDEGSGSSVSDSSGGGNGTLYGDYTWVDGQLNGAVQFAGNVQAYFEAPKTFDNFSEVTISFWYWNSGNVTTSRHYLLGNSRNHTVNDSVLSPGFKLITGWSDPNILNFRVVANNLSNHTGTVNNVPVNEWSHIVATYKPGAFRIYVNNELSLNMGYSSVTSIGSSSNFRIATSGNGAEHAPEGTKVDNVRIYNKAFSSDEVASLYYQDKHFFHHYVAKR